jgi:RNA polymerase sigma-70 factor (ECF subfamily)
MGDRQDGTDALWARVALGDEAAFGEVFTCYADRVYGHCVRRTGDWAAAEDLTSLVFLHAWRRRAEVPPDGVIAWLLGSANHLMLNHARTLRRNRSLVARLSAATATEADPSEDAVERLDAERQAQRVQAALAQLPRVSRDVLELVVWGGLTYEQAAKALAVPVGTVRSRLARARARLASLADTDIATTADSRLAAKDTWSDEMRSSK